MNPDPEHLLRVIRGDPDQEPEPPAIEVAGKFKWIPRRGAESLRPTGPYAVGGAQLWAYRAGCYRPGGEEQLRAKTASYLGDEWRRSRVDDVIAYMRDTAPRLADTPPFDLINVRNGLLNVNDSTLIDHDPGYLFPIQLAVEYAPDATCPTIDKFLADTLKPDLIPLLLEVIAYLITPDNSLQQAFMFTGPGGTGKSVTLNVIRALLGSENVSSVSLHQLDDDRFARADLYGRLANIFADLDARSPQSSSIFKLITGGDTIRGEHKHRPAFDFKPTARLLFSANEVPPTADSSNAFFDRWTIIPYEHVFRGTRREDTDLLDKLTTASELSGLLNHALAVLPALRKRGRFTTSATSDRAGEQYRTDADSVAGFIDECCDIDIDKRTELPAFYRRYREWCGDRGRQPLSAVRVNRRMRELRRIGETTVQGTHYWDGIGLRTATE